ncbi:benzoate/H(+) symporter BenE family transporter [Luteococcus sp. Sow4_B9]|uniref:benzoate/H(+) symporter BenE family transporter n=1 Tax=Luteococcus sp. Sow4_B9 TaxID=3438792 RepID=UPI003F95B39F
MNSPQAAAQPQVTSDPHGDERRQLRRDVSLSAVSAGLIAVAVSYAGPLLVVLEAARQGGLDERQTASWVWAVSVGAGLVCLFGSWLTRKPVMVAWSIPGAALLVTTLAEYSYSDVVGAFIVCGLACAVLGATGLVGKLLRATPRPITAAVLAGVLLPFALKVARAVAEQPVVAGGLVLGYLLGRRIQPRFAVILALVFGGILAVATGQSNPMSVELGLTLPVWTTPTFSLGALLGVALPLALVTVVGQDAPGLIAVHSSGYELSDRKLLGIDGVFSALFAPFGSHAISVAAVTAAIASSPEAHPDRSRRYIAGMSCGLFYLVGGFAATTIVSLFASIPAEMLTAVAGVALLSPLQAAVYDTMHEGEHHRSVTEAALLTLVVTASGVTILGLASAFWGLVAGLGAYAILRPRIRTAGAQQ